MRVRTPSGDRTAVITSWPCISPSGAEAIRELLATFNDRTGAGIPWTPEEAKEQGLAIVDATAAERRRLHQLGYRLSDTTKRPFKLFR